MTTETTTETIRFYSTKGPHGCFSNFSRHRVFHAGLSWPTSEHAFQAMKFADEAHRERIRRASSPAEAKRLGGSRALPIRADWDTARVEVMREIVRAKFSQHEDLRVILLGTGAARLVEHTARDAFWGDGGDGSGQNMLGRVLMEVRAELRDAA